MKSVMRVLISNISHQHHCPLKYRLETSLSNCDGFAVNKVLFWTCCHSGNDLLCVKPNHALCWWASDLLLESVWMRVPLMPVRRHTYRRRCSYLPKEDQWGSHRHAPGLIFYWLAPLSGLSLLAGSLWGRPVSGVELRWWRSHCQDDWDQSR